MPFKDPDTRLKYINRWNKSNRHRGRIYAKRHYDKSRQFIRELKMGLSCARCPENHWACIDFHHPNDKEHSIAQMVGSGYSKERILAEIAKCVVLCSNCHRKLHATISDAA